MQTRRHINRLIHRARLYTFSQNNHNHNNNKTTEEHLQDRLSEEKHQAWRGTAQEDFKIYE